MARHEEKMEELWERMVAALEKIVAAHEKIAAWYADPSLEPKPAPRTSTRKK